MTLLPVLNPEDAPELAATIKAAYLGSTYPWHRLLAAPGKDPMNLRVRLVRGIAVSGYFWPIGEIQLNIDHFGPGQGGYTFLHEAGHAVDFWTLTGEDRDELRESVGAARWWHADQGRIRSPGETFATVFARAFRPPHWPTPGPLSDAYYPMDEELVRTISLRRPLMPFDDIDHLPQAAQDSILRIADKGISLGTSDTTFSPDQMVPRWQMAIFLDRLYELLSP